MDVERAAHGRFSDVQWVEVTGSTNVDLRTSAQRHPNVATVLFADEQTAGRGRHERRWEMRAGGGLLVSFYVPWPAAETAHAVPTALGVAAITAIRSLGPEVSLKWPNDLVAADDRKVGGMLSEVVNIDGVFAGVIIGMGCNVHWPDAETVLPPGLENAVSLDVLYGQRVDRSDLAQALVAAFDRELESVGVRGVSSLHERYRSCCATIGRQVRIDLGDGNSFEGFATDVSADGALIVVVDGVQRRVDVGDVMHVRPDAG